MATTFQLKRSSVAGKVPNTSTLSIGELGLNLTDQILYSSNGTGVFELGANVTNQTIKTSLLVGNSSINTTVNSTSVSIGANNLIVGTSLYAVSNGNVGIGTSSPDTILDARKTNASYWGQTTTNTWGGTLTPPQALAITNSQPNGYDPVLLFRQATSTGTIKTSGAIGLVGGSNWIDGNDATQYSHMYFAIRNTTGGLQEIMRFTVDGRVGIGTISPAYTLDVNGSARSDYILFRSNSSAPTADAAIYRPANGTLGLVTNSSERMRITSAGNIYLGTTTDLGTTTRLSISYTGAGSMYGIEMKPTSSGSTYALYLRNYAGSFVGGINPTDSATNYLSASDYRLKENIVLLDDPIERLKQLLPRRFNFKNTPNNTVDGFIAHEVSSIVPEAVIGEKDQIDKNGKPVYQAMDNSKLVPLLTASIQKAIEKIEMLESRIQQLETN